MDSGEISPNNEVCKGLKFKETVYLLVFELIGFSLDYIHHNALKAAFSPRTIAYIGKAYVSSKRNRQKILDFVN